MKSEARRAAIVQAVLPVFARKGLNQATSRELADAADVSEALLFKHFPTKESLFAEVQSVCCGARDPGLERLAGLEPSTATLVRTLYHLVRSAALAAPHDDHQSAMRHRLFLGSCLGRSVRAGLSAGPLQPFAFRGSTPACWRPRRQATWWRTPSSARIASGLCTISAR